MEESLMLKKGGKLIETRWNPKTKSYVEKNVTKHAFRLLFQDCTLDKDLTLRDVFLLMKKHLEVFDSIFGNWCKEIVLEGLKKNKEKETQVDYLELYWDVRKGDKGSKDAKTSGLSFPYFHGMGKAQDDKSYGYKKGDWIPYGLSFSSATKLANLPLKLSSKLNVIDESDYKAPPLDLGSPTYTLGHILYGIIWELSVHGSPSSRDALNKELHASLDKYKKQLEEKKN